MASRYFVMKKNANLTEPAACLLAVSSSIALRLERPHDRLGRSLKRAASSLVLTCLKGNPHCPSGAERARSAAEACFKVLHQLDQVEAADPGMIHKALTLADRVLRTLPEPETQTAPLKPQAERKGPHAVLSLIPLAATGSRIP